MLPGFPPVVHVSASGRLTPGSPSKFLMAAFVPYFAQKVTAEIYPVQPLVRTFTAIAHTAHLKTALP